jgi:hypothetical protein
MWLVFVGIHMTVFFPSRLPVKHITEAAALPTGELAKWDHH